VNSEFGSNECGKPVTSTRFIPTRSVIDRVSFTTPNPDVYSVRSYDWAEAVSAELTIKIAARRGFMVGEILNEQF
jgi:hypothetical protein